MTDAGEKLQDRLVTRWAALPHCISYPKCDGDLEGMEHSEECPRHDSPLITSVDFTAMCVRAELERAAEIVDDCQCDRSAKCSCAEHAAAIRRRKE